jgi:hypothetical protein
MRHPHLNLLDLVVTLPIDFLSLSLFPSNLQPRPPLVLSSSFCDNSIPSGSPVAPRSAEHWSGSVITSTAPSSLLAPVSRPASPTTTFLQPVNPSVAFFDRSTSDVQQCCQSRRAQSLLLHGPAPLAENRKQFPPKPDQRIKDALVLDPLCAGCCPGCSISRPQPAPQEGYCLGCGDRYRLRHGHCRCYPIQGGRLR